MANQTVFVDANVFVYALDPTNQLFKQSVGIIQKLLDDEVQLCTSHHVIEEVLHIFQKFPGSGIKPTQVVKEIELIPNLELIEPAAKLDFAERYAALAQKLKLGVNDALILQLILDAGIKTLFSYDKKMLKAAAILGIKPIV